MSIEINGDTKAEPDETVVLELYRSKKAPIDKALGTGTIINDD